jgi:hypothetical protein
MAKEKWLTREDIEEAVEKAYNYDSMQARLLASIASILIDVRSLLGKIEEGTNGKNQGRR